MKELIKHKPFSWPSLATFDKISFSTPQTEIGTTEAGIVSFAVQGREQVYSVVAIYLITSLLTVWGIRRLLKQTRLPTNDRRRKPLRAYDEPTISFGRWTLYSTVVLSALFVLLILLGWFPGQDTRERFTEKTIAVNTSLLYPLVPKNLNPVDSQFTQDEKRLNLLYKWIFDGHGVGPTKQVLYIEQQTPFDSDYYSFAVEIPLKNESLFIDALAFLKTDTHDNEYRPGAVRLVAGKWVCRGGGD